MNNTKRINMHDFSEDMSIFDTFQVDEKYNKIEVSNTNINIEKLFMIGGSHSIKRLTIKDKTGKRRVVTTQKGNEIIYWIEKDRSGIIYVVVVVAGKAIRTNGATISVYHNNKYKVEALEIVNQHMCITITGNEDVYYSIPNIIKANSVCGAIDSIGVGTPIEWIDERTFRVGEVTGKYKSIENDEYAILKIRRYSLSLEEYFDTIKLISRKTERIINNCRDIEKIKDLGEKCSKLSGLYVISTVDFELEIPRNLVVDLRNNGKILLDTPFNIEIDSDGYVVIHINKERYSFITEDRELKRV